MEEKKDEEWYTDENGKKYKVEKPKEPGFFDGVLGCLIMIGIAAFFIFMCWLFTHKSFESSGSSDYNDEDPVEYQHLRE